MRFTVLGPPDGEVSLCWYRPPGGDVARCVHVGVAGLRIAGDACENRLALAVFGCDMPAGRASLRRVRGRNPLHPSRGFMVEPGDQPTPGLMSDRAVQAPLLRDANTGFVQRAPRGATHRTHIEVLYSNRIEAARNISRGLFDPVASPVGFASFESRNRELGASSPVRATLGACEALLKATQPIPLARCKARSVKQFSR